MWVFVVRCLLLRMGRFLCLRGLMAEAKSARGAARKTIGEMVNARLTPEKIGELVDEILDAKGLQFAYCSKCRSKVQVEVRDFPKVVQALKDLLAEAEGRPAGDEVLGTTVVVERPAYRDG